jgi:hypothetical protein
VAVGDTLAVLTPLGYEPTVTNYATLNVRNAHPILEFDTTTQETAIWTTKMPQNYAAGNLVVHLLWAAATAVTGTIGWDVTFEQILAGTLDIDADSFATAQVVTATTVSGTAGVALSTSVTCTAGATGTDNVAAGDAFRLRVRRDVATDTALGDAHLLTVEIREG